MGRILYVFPHPDDESFGPAPAIARQRREGHEVFLLTLTRGEATSQRHKFGLTKEEMAETRLGEMKKVAGILDLSGMTVLDLPDGELDTMDPIELESIVRSEIESVRPDVVVTYITHGCSGHLDHLVTHAVVKRVFCSLRAEDAPYPRRLALFTLDDDADVDRPAHLRGVPRERIDCIIPFTEADRRRGKEALLAYETYRDVVEKHRPLDTVANGVCFVFFGETENGRTDDLLNGLGNAP